MNSPQALKEALEQGPVSVSVAAYNDVWKNYKSGIITEGCEGKLDHAVVAVGWGNMFGIDYWILRNSWGTSWGENGYIRVADFGENGPGLCGVLSGPPSFPVTT